MILLCPPEKSTQFHYPLDPKKIRAEGSMHKDTTYQGSDRHVFYRDGKKKLKKRKKIKQTNKTQTSTGFAIGNPVTSINDHTLLCETPRVSRQSWPKSIAHAQTFNQSKTLSKRIIPESLVTRLAGQGERRLWDRDCH